MKKPKKSLALSQLGKSHTRQHLQRLMPFLSNADEQPTIKESELEDEKLLAKLFPNNPEREIFWLNALYTYKQCDTKTQEASTSQPSMSTQAD